MTTHPAKIFLVFSLLWGAVLVFLTPPFQVPDEPAHFYRAYQVSEFQFVSNVEKNKLGAMLPQSLLRLHKKTGYLPRNETGKVNWGFFSECLAIPLEPEKKTFKSFPNTSLYSPVAYLPQSTGIFIGRSLSLPPLVLLYLGRIFNLLFWITAIYLCLKIIPMGKWLFFSLALLPMSVHIAASNSADTVANGLSFLWIALILNLACNAKIKMQPRHFLLLIPIAILLSVLKNIYAPLLLLYFIIPAAKAESKKLFYGGAILLFCLSAITAIYNLHCISSLLGQIQPIEELYGSMPKAPKINPAKQIDYILGDIPGFFILVYHSFNANFDMLTDSYIGVLGWLELGLGSAYYLIAYITLFSIAVFDPIKKTVLSLQHRLTFTTLFLAIAFILAFTMYCSWSEPGAEIISGMSGRYFIPAAPLALLALGNNKFNLNSGKTGFVAICLAVLSMLTITQNMLQRYYF